MWRRPSEQLARLGSERLATMESVCQWFMKHVFDESPELQTYRGRKTCADKVDRYDIAGLYMKREEFCREVQKKLSDINPADLSEANIINHQMLQHYAQICLEGLQLKPYLFPLNFWEGPEFYFMRYTLPYTTFSEPEDFENYIKRLREFPKQVHDCQILLETGIKEGIMPHNVSLETVVPRLKGLSSCRPEDCVFLKPFEKKPDYLDQEKWGRLVIQAVEALKEVQKNLGQLATFIKEEYIPNCRQDISISSISGVHRYATYLKFYTDLDLTPEEVHNIGKQEVQKLVNKMNKVMEKFGFHGTMQELAESLNQKEGMFCWSEEELLEYYQHLRETVVRPRLSKLFHHMPQHKLVFTIVQADLAPTAAEYNGPSEDGSQPGRVTVTYKQLDKYPKYLVPVLLVHEGEPGHHFQASYALSQPDLPDFRKVKDDRRYFESPGRFPLNAAYTEGWGLYAEELGEQIGVYKDPADEFGYLTFNLLRATRVVVDTGIHAMGWTKEQACEFLRQNTAIEEDSIISEVNRYITWPGQACSYKIGHMKIIELREKAKQELGPLFDIRDFHAAVLDVGQVPLNILESVVDMYIKKKRSQTQDVPGADT